MHMLVHGQYILEAGFEQRLSFLEMKPETCDPDKAVSVRFITWMKGMNPAVLFPSAICK